MSSGRQRASDIDIEMTTNSLKNLPTYQTSNIKVFEQQSIFYVGLFMQQIGSNLLMQKALMTGFAPGSTVVGSDCSVNNDSAFEVHIVLLSYRYLPRHRKNAFWSLKYKLEHWSLCLLFVQSLLSIGRLQVSPFLPTILLLRGFLTVLERVIAFKLSYPMPV